MACQFLLAVRVVLNYTSRAITVSQRKLRKKKQAKVPRHYADKSNPHYAERKTRKTSAASPLPPALHRLGREKHPRRRRPATRGLDARADRASRAL